MKKFIKFPNRQIQSHKSAWPFIDPVDASEVPDYYNVIKEPMGKFNRNSKFLQLSSLSNSPRRSQIDRAQSHEPRLRLPRRLHQGHDEDLRQLSLLQPPRLDVLQVRRGTRSFLHPKAQQLPRCFSEILRIFPFPPEL